MAILSYVLRVIALSFLFAGSSSIVFAAITLVNAAHERGVPIPEAAAANAPMFTMFSIVAFICAILLLVAEALHYAKHRLLTNPVKARYAASLLCVAAALVLKIGIIPQMEELSTKAADDKEAHAAFMKLHSVSRIDFSVIIVTALIALLLPGFDSKTPLIAKKPEEAPAVS